MGGAIGVESAEAGGSTFWFTVVLGKGAVARPLPSGAQVDMGGRRVLVVDDNETNRTLLERLLTAEGMQVETAAGLREALALGGGSSTAPFSVAILDFAMPEMDGVELGRRLHALPSWG